jgi:hypothetical protein
MEDDIALNLTLKENLFVTIICILNRVPVFLVGKPGTSKSITFVPFLFNSKFSMSFHTISFHTVFKDANYRFQFEWPSK